MPLYSEFPFVVSCVSKFLVCGWLFFFIVATSYHAQNDGYVQAVENLKSYKPNFCLCISYFVAGEGNQTFVHAFSYFVSGERKSHFCPCHSYFIAGERNLRKEEIILAEV